MRGNGVDVQLSVDKAEAGWEGYTGFVPANVLDKQPSPDNTIAITCGPPIMIKFVIQNLQASSDSPTNRSTRPSRTR